MSLFHKKTGNTKFGFNINKLLAERRTTDSPRYRRFIITVKKIIQRNIKIYNNMNVKVLQNKRVKGKTLID